MNGPDFQYDGLTAFAPITSAATAKKKGLLSAADKAKLDSYTTAGGVVVATYTRRLYGLAGEAVVSNPGTGWVAVSRRIYTGVETDLPAVATGAKRRYRWVTQANTFATNGTSAGNIWLTSGGVPGTGTTLHTISVPHHGWNAGDVFYAVYQGPLATPYNTNPSPLNNLLQFYSSGPSGGGTLWVHSIDLIVEDYV